MRLRRDHVAGGVAIIAGALLLAVSGDLPFGTLASPGAGMLPTLVIGLMMGFGLALIVRAGASPPIGDIVWADLGHALSVALITAAAVALYIPLGFLVAMSALLLVLTVVAERRLVLPAAAFSIGVTALAYALFSVLLKTPLPRGLIGF